MTQNTSGLPKLTVATYDLILPITKMEIKFRPFLVKEEKLLLMAAETKNAKDIVNAIKQISINCVLEPKIFVPDNIPMVDIEYLFLNIRGKSIEEVIETQFKCNNVVSENDEDETKDITCGNIMKIKIPISELKVVNLDTYTDDIKIKDGIGIKMKIPKFSAINKFMDKDSNFVDGLFDMIVSSIDYIYDNETVYQSKDFKKAELIEFVENMGSNTFENVQNYFESLPKIDYTVNHACGKCGFQHKIEYKDISDFF